MSPPGGGRNPVTPRLLRHFCTLSFAELADASVARIFGTILAAHTSRHCPEAVQDAVAGVVDATIAVYNAARAELLPTPSKSHYTFNLRDMAKVVQGCMRGDPRTCTSPEALLVLWLHEATRVFGDRLVSDEDRAWFAGAADAQLQQRFGTAAAALAPEERLVFGDFMVPSAQPISSHCRPVCQLKTPQTAHAADFAHLACPGPKRVQTRSRASTRASPTRRRCSAPWLSTSRTTTPLPPRL